jgi:hypothetical protein
MSDPNVIISPNMGLPLPIPNQDPGPDYANNQNAAGLIIDAHNHSAGNGVQITPSGLSISSDLTFLGNNATNLRSTRFSPQGSALSGAADLGCVYVSGVDLYYNDVNGNQIRITQTGSVTGASGTITGLPSGTASAAYSGGTFVFQSATNTGANIDGASYILRNASANSKGLTLSPPSAMAANYTLVLPALPSSTSWVQLDTAGNITASTPVSGGLTTSNLSPTAGILGSQLSASAAIVGTQLVNGTIGTTQLANAAVTQAKLATGLTLQNASVISTTGSTQSFTAPVANLAIFGCGGGGGGGGGGTAGGGGGVGCVPIVSYITVTPGDILQITVGAGGTATVGGNGGAGGDTFVYGPSATFTCNTVAASNVLTSVSSVTGVRVGQTVSGTGIPTNAVIISVGTNTVTINAYCTTAHSTVTVTAKQLLFYAPGGNAGAAGASGTGAGGSGPSTVNGSFVGGLYFTSGGSGNTGGSNGQNSMYALGGTSAYGSGSGTGSGTPGLAGAGYGAGGGGGGSSSIGGQYGGGGGAGMFAGGGGGTFAVTTTSPLQSGGVGYQGVCIFLWAGT